MDATPSFGVTMTSEVKLTLGFPFLKYLQRILFKTKRKMPTLVDLYVYVAEIYYAISHA